MSEDDRSAQEKRRQLQVMLDAGLVMLHLDPRGEDVVVPGHFKRDPVLRLNLAWGFNLPALDVGVDSVYAVLSFNRQNFGCTLPWSAIFAMTAPDSGHEGVVWPESVPTELAPYFQAAGQSSGGVPVSLRAEERPRRPEALRPRAPSAPTEGTEPHGDVATRPPALAAALASTSPAGSPAPPGLQASTPPAGSPAPPGLLPSTPPAGSPAPPGLLATPPRPLFVVHEGGRGEDEAPPEPASDGAEAAPRQRPNLRLVKD